MGHLMPGQLGANYLVANSKVNVKLASHETLMRQKAEISSLLSFGSYAVSLIVGNSPSVSILVGFAMWPIESTSISQNTSSWKERFRGYMASSSFAHETVM
jgi:hypothetical protein